MPIARVGCRAQCLDQARLPYSCKMRRAEDAAPLGFACRYSSFITTFARIISIAAKCAVYAACPIVSLGDEMNENRTIRRAFCRFAAIALALMSTAAFAAPALAYADDSVNVTVNVTATTESGEKVGAEEALLQVNAMDGEDLSIEGTPYRSSVSYETSNPVVSGQATYFSVTADCGRLCYLKEIVLSDNATGKKVVFSCPGGEDHVGGSFGGTSMVGTYAFGGSKVRISQTKYWGAGE